MRYSIFVILLIVLSEVCLAQSPAPNRTATEPDCRTDCPSTVIDIDGNIYQTVLIGNQCWMAENLKVTHYRNGDSIPNVTDSIDWHNLTTGAYCDYENDSANVATYGRIYNWYAVDDIRGLAPQDWHVPTDEEWKEMEMYLGMSQSEAGAYGWRGTDEGGKLKEVGTIHWNSPNEGATNESGFTALPAGWRHGGGNFGYMGDIAFFWCSRNLRGAEDRSIYYNSSQIFRDTDHGEIGGHSVRCVRDWSAILIDPSPDSLDAPWELSGPNGYSISGSGDSTISGEELEPGQYTLQWGTVSGWQRPAGSTKLLSDKTPTIFRGLFIEAPDSTGSVTDIDGNIYQTVKIGDLWWMAENLKVTHYQNGDPIQNVTITSEWADLTTGAYCDYNNDGGYVIVYGRLYNWYAINDGRDIAPEGWSVPSNDDLKQLEMYLGMSQAEADSTGWRGTDEGGKLKEAGTEHWQSPNTGAT
ncbi:MAG: hypothetical protein GWN61_10935, partial [candidate division Zixibacteria bacterium]|nr:hypothetical protein [candidate division Zixibacteria bacterium]NIR64714.1 hypothetical protein [candidate division Zixibacteria bacterium]NIS17043.1 hypothetical protein [candidate division Zixibacteria bacterium]NIS46551.1 hypothetical protein [candidate division Zixibacteria bacterium]NIU14671.1 hypothetical protein [candidate division Zixibacteria bacterium]